MIYKRLILRNFLAYKNIDLNYDNLPAIFTLSGVNGAGKSSLVTDAVLYALFGSARGDEDELIYSTENKMFIQFEFEMNGQHIKICREKTRNGKSKLELSVDGQDVTEGKRETQNKINNIIKITPDVFLSATCIAQRGSDEFMKIGASKRKEVLYDILALNVYGTLEKEAKISRDELKRELDDIENKLKNNIDLIDQKQNYENQIIDNENNLKNLNIQLQDYNKQLEEELAQKTIWLEKMKKKEQNKRKIDSLNNEINTLNSNIKAANELIVKCNNILSEKDNIENKINELKKLCDNLNTVRIEKSNEISALKSDSANNKVEAKKYKDKYDKLKNYNEAICSQCGQEVNEEHKEKTLNEYMMEGKKYLKIAKELDEKIANLTTELDKIIQEYNSKSNELNIYQSKKTAIDQATIKLQNANDNLNSYQERLIKVQNDLEEVKKEVIEDVEQKIWKDDQLRTLIDRTQREINASTSIIAVAKSKIKEIEEAESSVNDLLIRKDELINDITKYNELIKAWSKKGIPATIIENAIPDIENEANSFLNKMTDGRVSIKFITQKENKSNDNVVETLDIIVTDELGTRRYEMYSGGEKFRIEFALYMGMAIFLANRSGANIKTFIIDEGFGALDDEGFDQFIDAITLAKKYFDKIIIITHIEALKEAFEGKIEVYKTPNEGSKLKIIA